MFLQTIKGNVLPKAFSIVSDSKESNSDRPSVIRVSRWRALRVRTANYSKTSPFFSIWIEYPPIDFFNLPDFTINIEEALEPDWNIFVSSSYLSEITVEASLLFCFRLRGAKNYELFMKFRFYWNFSRMILLLKYLKVSRSMYQRVESFTAFMLADLGDEYSKANSPKPSPE